MGSQGIPGQRLPALGAAAALEQRQELRTDPRLYQAMELMYLPLPALQARIEDEILTNPYLQWDDDARDQPDDQGDQPDAREPVEFDWREAALVDTDSGWYEEGPGRSLPSDGSPVPDADDLWDRLRQQLALIRLGERERAIGEEIIGNINSEGYLTCALAEIAAGAPVEGVTEKEVEAVLREVQQFDPAGVAARNLQECLLIQLREQGRAASLAARILRDGLEALARRDWTSLANKLGVSAAEVEAAADEISRLDPRPGLVHADLGDSYVTPELRVTEEDGVRSVVYSSWAAPRVRVAAHGYPGDTANKSLSEARGRARWLVRAMEQRRMTLLQIAGVIVEKQRGFFEKGEIGLAPLTRREVAHRLGVNESTVSRAVHGKYIETPRGTRPLQFFFSAGVPGEGGSAVSATAVRARIRTLIAREDPTVPLSDASIQENLEEEGVKVARRTVAKYRSELRIPPARERRRAVGPAPRGPAGKNSLPGGSP